jgi:hypothetical protein
MMFDQLTSRQSRAISLQQLACIDANTTAVRARQHSHFAVMFLQLSQELPNEPIGSDHAAVDADFQGSSDR